MSDRGTTSALKYTISASVACVGAGLCASPYDVVRDNMKKYPHIYQTRLQTIRKIYKKHSFSAFFRASTANMATMFPFFALSFLGYGIGKGMLQRSRQREDLSKIQLLMAGSFGGFVLASYTAAAERAMDLLAIQKTKPYPEYIGPVHALKEQFRLGGFRRVYWGGLATYLRDMPSCAVFFATYEIMRRRFRKPDEKKSTIGMVRTMVSGAVAGGAMWFVVTPAEVLKMNMKIAPGKFKKISVALKEIVREEGPFGFYRGKTHLLFRALPAHAGGFLTFELIRKFVNHELPNL